MIKDGEPGKCTYKRRMFILVAEIPREKVNNTKRNLVCMCSGCLERFECCNKKYVEPWKTHSTLESSKEIESQQMQESNSVQEEFEQRVMLQKTLQDEW